MDILAHTLWASAGAREANKISAQKNNKLHINVLLTGFFGVFPDLFAFTIPFIARFYLLFTGKINADGFAGRPDIGSSVGFDLAHTLYQYSHSLVIWAVVFMIVWFYYKRPRYELLGWALHILIDIPTHVLAFFPTPFLFPISDYKFPYGMQWSNTYFMMVNYTLLLLVWGRMLVLDLKVKYQAKYVYK